ncbi:MAG: hypothetical protein PHP59_08140 [Methanofollis sp.]|nr:hypothetical protein [Methanofollis sp.]MDD4255330.1 hypothetical protein [Methanofollis sp.]
MRGGFQTYSLLRERLLIPAALALLLAALFLALPWRGGGPGPHR